MVVASVIGLVMLRVEEPGGSRLKAKAKTKTRMQERAAEASGEAVVAPPSRYSLLEDEVGAAAAQRRSCV